MYVLLPPFGVAIRGKWHSLQLVALGIPYSGNTKVRCDPGFSLDTFYINKCNFCYPFLPLLGVLLGVKATLRLLPLVIPYSGTLRYDMTLVLALRFYINTCQFCYPFLLNVKKKCKCSFYIAQYPVRWTAQSALHFCPPWQTCSFRHQLGFSGKHSSDAAITRKD